MDIDDLSCHVVHRTVHHASNTANNTLIQKNDSMKQWIVGMF